MKQMILACLWWLTSPTDHTFFQQQPSLSFSTTKDPNLSVIAIDDTRTFQTIDGFGFALTGGSAQHLMNMSPARRSATLQQLFAKDGDNIGVSYLRITIGASDLNDHTFSYDDLPSGQTDPHLERFDLGPDKQDVIPVLKEILTINPHIKILASPWSAPTWMKTNNDIQGGHLKEIYYPVYAQYFLKYLNAMQQQGITIDALTLQNEPFNNGNTPSMQMFAKEQARFIRDHLGPLFKANGIRTKIILYDHNCDAPEYPISILSDKAAYPYIDGSAFHLYAGPITALSKVHDAFPEKNCYFTEMMVTSRNGNFNIASPTERIIIGAMRNYSRNVILWNLAANSRFEPHTPNGGCPFCQGALTIDGDSTERNAAYYTIAHASKFVEPGSVRIASGGIDGLPNVAFATPDGNIVLIVANTGKTQQSFIVSYNGKFLNPHLEAGAVATYTFPQEKPTPTTASPLPKPTPATTSPLVKVASGLLSGQWETKGVRVFKGIPYAAPPVGPLRWKEPQPVHPWQGIRPCTEFGNHPMQVHIWDDMIFRSRQGSEDCLYLNVWTNATTATEKLPVFVYFHGGGLFAGDGSEPRYDGTSFAQKSIVVVTVNYRLGIFGFFSHPGLTRESPHHASGNYGFLDQTAALKWVQQNITAFGGDPAQVTIGGQSAGSRSVSGQMCSPLATGLFIHAIGESGSMMGTNPIPTLEEAEGQGARFASALHASTIEELRKIPADQLLTEAVKSGISFGTVVDGFFLPQQPIQLYATGKQADIPLLAGWNSAEVSWKTMLGSADLTRDSYEGALHLLYGDRAGDVLRLYPDSTQQLLLKSATDLASDRYIAYGTWKWIDLHGKTNGHPVYRYLFSHTGDTTPALPGAPNSQGAPHSSELPYVFGTLDRINTNKWTAADYRTSATLQQYFANFIKTGDPNGANLPQWSGLQSSIPKVMVMDTTAHQQPETNARRYQLLDQLYNK